MQIKNPVLKQIWEDRYKKDIDNDIKDNLKRVSKYCAKTPSEEKNFFNIMDKGLFFPAGRVMSNSGIGENLTLNNCFTLNFVPDSIKDIFETVKIGALTQQKGGGTGYNFSLIRPKGTPTSNDAIASGVVSFMDAFNSQTATILQGGRRGANMGVLSVRHPDIYDFINAKSYEEGKLVHFNLSVLVDKDFMKAVENNENFTLHYPIFNDRGEFITDESKWTHKKTIKAVELWDLIMKKAYDNGEPGILFYDNLNKSNNTYYCENIIAVNPCSEFISGVLYGNGVDKNKKYFGACNLGSLFLHNFVKYPFTEDAHIDYNLLEDTIDVAMKMLNNIIDINKYPYEAFENYQKSMRTVGLGITGLADLLCMMNMKYGDRESLMLVDNLMNFITKKAYRSSINLAKVEGQFELLDRKKFIKSNFIQQHIKQDMEWLEIAQGILKHGIRNARIISVAPTGTLSLTYGNNCSSGLEPIFSLSYKRKVKIGGQDESNIQIIDMKDYAYEEWEKIKDNPNCIVKKDIFVTAMELPVRFHIDMLGVITKHVDMNCSKTINIPTEYSFKDTKKIYMDCWKKGVKGCTIFRPNPLREGILVNSNENQDDTKSIKAIENELKRGDWKPKADDTVYYNRKVNIGCGKLKLMIGWSEEEKTIQDMYVIRSGSGGCERNLQGMMIAMSGMLRLGGDIFNIEKAFEGMGSCNSFIAKRVKSEEVSKGGSCGSAILNEIKTFLKEKQQCKNNDQAITSKRHEKTKKENKFRDTLNKTTQQEEVDYLKENGEIAFVMKYNKCPNCGEELQHSGGCISCQSCGFSKCE